MLPLLTSNTDATHPSQLSAFKSPDVATVESILAESKAEKGAINKKKKKDADPVLLQINTRADAIDKCKRRNKMVQAIIGAKEGLADALRQKVGERIVDTIIKTADGSFQFSKYEILKLNMVRWACPASHPHL